MSTGYPLVNPRFKCFVKGTNAPLSGGLVYFYSDPGFSIFAPVYSDIGCTIPLSNPVVLDVYGEAEIFGNNIYYIRVADANAVTQYTISGISFAPAAGTVSQSDWLLQSSSITYVSSTSFTIAGNQTGVFHPSRRIKVLVTAGTLYGTVVSSAFSTVTTVVVSLDSGSLDSGLSAVSVGLLDSQNTSIPNLNPLPTTTGGTTAYLLTVQRGDLIKGTRIQAIINATNTGASTIAINGGAVTPINKFGAVALIAGDLQINQIHDFEFDGTNWQLLNPYTVNVVFYGVDSGAVNAYVVTTEPFALIAGQGIIFKVANTNTGASTLNVNGTGVKSLVRVFGSNLAQPILPGELLLNELISVIYDGTNWVVQNTGSRIKTLGGSALVAGDIGSLTGWGSSPTINTPSGTDTHGIISISCGGTPSINPYFTLTFHNGTFTTAPFVVACLCNPNLSGGPTLGSVFVAGSSATSVAIGYAGTPVASTTYQFMFIAIG